MSRDGEVGEGNLAGEEPVRKCQGEESQEEFPPPDGEAPEHQAEEAQDGQEVEPEKKEDEGSEEYEAGGGTAAKKEGEEEEEEEEEEGEEEDLKGLKEGQSEEDEDDTEDVEAEQDEEKEAVGGVLAPAAGTAVAKNCEEGAGADEVDGPSQEDGGGHRLSTVLAAGKPGRAVRRQKSDPEAPPKKSQKVEPPGGAAHARDGSQKGRKLKAQFSNPEAPPRKICKAADAAPKAEASPQGSKAGLRKIARPLTVRGSASQGGFADDELVRLQQDIQTAAARGNFETAAALQDRKKEIEGGRCHVGKVPEEGAVVRDGMDVKNKAKLLMKKAAASRDFKTASAVQEKIARLGEIEAEIQKCEKASNYKHAAALQKEQKQIEAALLDADGAPVPVVQRGEHGKGEVRRLLQDGGHPSRAALPVQHGKGGVAGISNNIKKRAALMVQEAVGREDYRKAADIEKTLARLGEVEGQINKSIKDSRYQDVVELQDEMEKITASLLKDGGGPSGAASAAQHGKGGAGQDGSDVSKNADELIQKAVASEDFEKAAAVQEKIARLGEIEAEIQKCAHAKNFQEAAKLQKEQKQIEADLLVGGGAPVPVVQRGRHGKGGVGREDDGKAADIERKRARLREVEVAIQKCVQGAQYQEAAALQEEHASLLEDGGIASRASRKEIPLGELCEGQAMFPGLGDLHAVRALSLSKVTPPRPRGKGEEKGKGKKGKEKSDASQFLYVGKEGYIVTVHWYGDEEKPIFNENQVGSLLDLKDVQARPGQLGQLFAVRSTEIRIRMEPVDAPVSFPYHTEEVANYFATWAWVQECKKGTMVDLVVQVTQAEQKETSTSNEPYMQVWGKDMEGAAVGPLRFWRHTEEEIEERITYIFRGMKVVSDQMWSEDLWKYVSKPDGPQTLECNPRTAIENVDGVSAIMAYF